jgi:hypothetical protein
VSQAACSPTDVNIGLGKTSGVASPNTANERFRDEAGLDVKGSKPDIVTVTLLTLSRPLGHNAPSPHFFSPLDERGFMSRRRVLPQNQESMLEWLEQRRIALIAAYRAVLLADGPTMTVKQLDEAVERWTEFAIGRSTYRERRRIAS